MTFVSWREIAQSIEADIKARMLSPGDKLPTEHALARKFMVNRHTVRRALADLQRKGLVESTQGRGSYVRRPALPIPISRRTRFSENAKRLSASHRHETLCLDVRPADATMAAALGLKFGAPVVFLERLGFMNDLPVGIGRHVFSHERLPLFPKMYPGYGSITRTLMESGIPDYVRVWTRVISRLPLPGECDLLAMPRHVPLLVTHSLNHDGLGRPLEYGEARFASDRVELVVESAAQAAAEAQGAGNDNRPPVRVSGDAV